MGVTQARPWERFQGVPQVTKPIQEHFVGFAKTHNTGETKLQETI